MACHLLGQPLHHLLCHLSLPVANQLCNFLHYDNITFICKHLLLLLLSLWVYGGTSCTLTVLRHESAAVPRRLSDLCTILSPGSPGYHYRFKVNLDKNCLNPSQTIFSIGVALVTTTTMAFLSPHREDDILYLLPLLQRSRLVPYVAHLRLFDMLTSQLVVVIVFIVPPVEVVYQFDLDAKGNRHWKLKVSQQYLFVRAPWRACLFRTVPVQGYPHGLYPFSTRGCHHRCLPHRMGSMWQNRTAQGRWSV